MYMTDENAVGIVVKCGLYLRAQTEKERENRRSTKVKVWIYYIAVGIRSANHVRRFKSVFVYRVLAPTVKHVITRGTSALTIAKWYALKMRSTLKFIIVCSLCATEETSNVRLRPKKNIILKCFSICFYSAMKCLLKWFFQSAVLPNVTFYLTIICSYYCVTADDRNKKPCKKWINLIVYLKSIF